MINAPEIPRIVMACEVNWDGVGDFYSLIDAVKDKDRFMEGYLKDIFILTHHTKEQNEHFKDCLEKQGFEVFFVGSPSSIERVLKSGNLPTEKAFILMKSDEINKEATLKMIEKCYVGMVDISFPLFYSFSQSMSIPRLCIAEHGSATKSGNFNIIPMQLSSGTESIFLSNESRENPGKQLAEVLSKDQNSGALKALLGVTSQEKSEIQNQCDVFLQDNLFVPSYLQHGKVEIVNFINTVAASSLSVQYKSIVFFLNKEGVDYETLRAAADKGYFSDRVKEVVVVTKDGEMEIPNPNAKSTAKTVRLVVGYRVPDDNDYKKLFHCAQHFAGCSGDKSLELVLSNGLIPLFVPHNEEKESFIKDISKIDKRFKLVEKIIYNNYLYFFALQETEPSNIKKRFFPNVEMIDLQLFEYKIDKASFPDSIKQWIELNVRSGVELSEKQQDVLIEEFVMHLFPALMKAEIKRTTDGISVALNQSFFEDWINFCEKLKKEYNLHDKLPNIVNTFFLENGLTNKRNQIRTRTKP